MPGSSKTKKGSITLFSMDNASRPIKKIAVRARPYDVMQSFLKFYTLPLFPFSLSLERLKDSCLRRSVDEISIRPKTANYFSRENKIAQGHEASPQAIARFCLICQDLSDFGKTCENMLQKKEMDDFCTQTFQSEKKIFFLSKYNFHP